MAELTEAEYRQDADDIPHFAYYDAKTLLSFTWDGSAEHPIQVAFGGYGERVIDHIDLPPGVQPKRFPHEWLEWYRTICLFYIQSKLKREAP